MSILREPVSQTVWDLKYRYQKNGQIIDQTIEGTWQRVAQAIAQAEKPSERAHWQQAFYQILDNFQFLPGGRILAGAGTTHQVTLFNCFVMNIAEDSLTGIFHALEEGALTLQQGGGVGYDFSVLRPEGSLVKKTGLNASGPVSFMRIWDTMCSVLLSTGARRGAMMGVLRCDHPDIEKFIAAKKDARELRHFNVSVMVSDEFMDAVRKDSDWALVFPVDVENTHDEIIYKRWGNSFAAVPCKIYKRVRARALWNQIIHSAYDYAEPGVLFSDTINRLNNLWYCERINATNPCGEIPLPPYGACDLGSVNLTQFVENAFSANAKINWPKLEEVTRVATRFLDNVIDVSGYPLENQKQQAYATRRMGLGLTGLGDALVMLGIQYGSPESVKLAGEIMQRIAYATWYTSVELAKEKGVFPLYQADYLQGKFFLSLDESLQQAVNKYGVRNSHHNTIAPTGTISLLANNVSNGIEPIFLSHYNRHMRMLSGETETFQVQDYAYRVWKENKRVDVNNVKELPSAWVDSQMLTPTAHLHIQAAMQAHVDNSISKTINIPPHFPFENLAEVYTHAYELGLKGCTVFRPNPITGSILEVPEEHCGMCEGDIVTK